MCCLHKTHTHKRNKQLRSIWTNLQHNTMDQDSQYHDTQDQLVIQQFHDLTRRATSYFASLREFPAHHKKRLWHPYFHKCFEVYSMVSMMMMMMMLVSLQIPTPPPPTLTIYFVVYSCTVVEISTGASIRAVEGRRTETMGDWRDRVKNRPTLLPLLVCCSLERKKETNK